MDFYTFIIIVGGVYSIMLDLSLLLLETRIC